MVMRSPSSWGAAWEPPWRSPTTSRWISCGNPLPLTGMEAAPHTCCAVLFFAFTECFSPKSLSWFGSTQQRSEGVGSTWCRNGMNGTKWPGVLILKGLLQRHQREKFTLCLVMLETEEEKQFYSWASWNCFKLLKYQNLAVEPTGFSQVCVW